MMNFFPVFWEIRLYNRNLFIIIAAKLPLGKQYNRASYLVFLQIQLKKKETKIRSYLSKIH